MRLPDISNLLASIKKRAGEQLSANAAGALPQNPAAPHSGTFASIRWPSAPELAEFFQSPFSFKPSPSLRLVDPKRADNAVLLSPEGVRDASRASSGLLVQFDAGVTQRDKAAILKSIGVGKSETLRAGDGSFGDLVLVNVANASAALQTLNATPGVRYAERNWTVGVQAVANDTYYTNGSLWGMYGDQTTVANPFGSQAGEAWAQGYVGSSKVVVGNVDTGMDYTHADLYLNVWLNQGELPVGMALNDTDVDGLITFIDLNHSLNASFVSDLNGNARIDAGDLLRDARWENGHDGDGNGYIDDLIGWDFVNRDNDPYDDNGHGTHTSGTIGASGGNGAGVAGVAWNVQIMPLKFLAADGSGSLSGAVSALNYYTNAAVMDRTKGWSSEFIATNNSWGGGGYDRSLLDSINYAARNDILFVAAAGNNASNNDASANYPSNYSTMSAAGYESVIAVAALTSSGALASFSNYGATTVDLGAPGAGIWSTMPGGGYASYNGTSMAAPHVTGALALHAALNPGYSASQLRDALLGSTAMTPSLSGKTVTGGRLDVGALMGGATVTPPPPPSAELTLYGTTGSDTLIGGAYDDLLSGIPASGSNLGRGTVDRLTGLGGNDLFLLGDARGRFYDDGNGRNAGKNDYGLINDFQKGDQIQLYGGDYFLANTTVSKVSGCGVFADSNANMRFDSTDEMIGLIKNVSASAMAASDFVWA